MKFFKHFTDAHRGSSLKILRKKFGMAGVGRYWVLVELCAEKMNKDREEEYSEEHVIFQFEKAYLMSSLGYANLKQALSYLEALAELGLCSLSDHGEVWSCSMPKLLECIDRDNNRARPVRASDAPKNKKKNKEEDKDFRQKWFYEAEACFTAVRLCSDDDQALEWLGQSRAPYIAQLGGISFIRSLKQNDFESKRLASLIQGAWEMLNEKESA